MSCATTKLSPAQQRSLIQLQQTCATQKTVSFRTALLERNILGTMRSRKRPRCKTCTVLQISTDPQTDVALGMAQGRNVRSTGQCSMCPAIHTNSRSWLRSSSTHEPSDPPSRVFHRDLKIYMQRAERNLHAAAKYTVGRKKKTTEAATCTRTDARRAVGIRKHPVQATL